MKCPVCKGKIDVKSTAKCSECGNVVYPKSLNSFPIIVLMLPIKEEPYVTMMLNPYEIMQGMKFRVLKTSMEKAVTDNDLKELKAIQQTMLEEANN